MQMFSAPSNQDRRACIAGPSKVVLRTRVGANLVFALLCQSVGMNLAFAP
jgi:hypothetical protein